MAQRETAARQLSESVFAFGSRAAETMLSGAVISGTDALLVDPGVLPLEIEAMRRFVRGRGAIVSAILLTHHHWDHVLATPDWPSARRIAHPALEPLVRAGQAQPEYRKMLDDLCAAQGCATYDRFELLPIDEQAADGMPVRVGSLDCRVVLLPGHAMDAAGLLVEAERVLFSTDMLDPCELPMPDHELELYLESLDRIESLVRSGAVDRVVPGHGWPLDTPAEILAQLAGDREYLRALGEAALAARAAGELESAAWERLAAITYRGKGVAARDREHRANALSVMRGARGAT